MRKPVQIDSIPADGAELNDDQLATMLGGKRKDDRGKPGPGSSYTLWDIDNSGAAYQDTDADF